MLSIKNSKGLSKNELLKINELFSICLGYDGYSNISDCHIISSNMAITQTDPTLYDIHNVLSNEYVIFEMISNKVSGALGIVTSNNIAFINQLHILDTYDAKLGKKLIGMVQMITKNVLLVVINKNNSNLIEFYKHIDFIFCELEDIDYDEASEVVMMRI